MSVLGTEVRMRRWLWAGVGCIGIAGLSALTRNVEFALPMALRLISAPEVFVLIAIVLATHPLLERLPQFSVIAVRERTLRPVRSMASLLLTAVAIAPGVATIPHLPGFGFGLWAVTVLVIVAASGSLAWMVPTIGGMAIFITDGGMNTPISDAIKTPIGTTTIGVLVLFSLVSYAVRGANAARAAHA